MLFTRTFLPVSSPTSPDSPLLWPISTKSCSSAISPGIPNCATLPTAPPSRKSRLAINRVWNNDQGQKQEETTFVDVTLWGRQAELAQQYLTKGRPVYIEGRLQMDTWDDKETGKKRSKLKVIGENLQFLSGKPGATGGGNSGGGYSERPQQAIRRTATTLRPAARRVRRSCRRFPGRRRHPVLISQNRDTGTPACSSHKRGRASSLAFLCRDIGISSTPVPTRKLLRVN